MLLGARTFDNPFHTFKTNLILKNLASEMFIPKKQTFLGNFIHF